LFGLIPEVPEAQMETQLRRVAADFETLYGAGPHGRSHAPPVAPCPWTSRRRSRRSWDW